MKIEKRHKAVFDLVHYLHGDEKALSTTSSFDGLMAKMYLHWYKQGEERHMVCVVIGSSPK